MSEYRVPCDICGVELVFAFEPLRAKRCDSCSPLQERRVHYRLTSLPDHTHTRDFDTIFRAWEEDH